MATQEEIIRDIQILEREIGELNIAIVGLETELNGTKVQALKLSISRRIIAKQNSLTAKQN